MNKEGGEVNSTSKKDNLDLSFGYCEWDTETLQMQWQWLDTYGAPTDIRDQQMTSDAGWKRHTEHRDLGAGWGESCVGLLWV